MIALLFLIAFTSVSCRNRREIEIHDEDGAISGNNSNFSFVREMLNLVEGTSKPPKSIFVVFYDSAMNPGALNETYTKIENVCLKDEFVNSTQLNKIFVGPFTKDDSESVRSNVSIVVPASSGHSDEHFGHKSKVYCWSNFDQASLTVLDKFRANLTEELDGEN
ncbi:hypothetical protein ACOME3_007525 [Neoechinorhynchus agilis]